jgi:hypothetical protein
MHCIYLNLDRQTDRRAFVERGFDRYADPDWTLHRFPAVDASTLSVRFAAGTLLDAEKACFASHVGALERALELPGDVMILEDDVWFGPRTADLLNEARSALAGTACDLLYPDVCIVDPRQMLDLFLLRRDWETTHRSRLLDLRDLKFAGATAYVVRAQAKAALAAHLGAVTQFDVPFDLVLRDLVHGGALAARAIFPFATSLSGHAERSQIQPGDTVVADTCWNAFRRLVCADGETLRTACPHGFGGTLPACEIAPIADFARVLAFRLSPAFPVK